ncbi:SH3 domain-containing protein [Streptomyces sp. NBC_00654]|uniref:SH3 domain-containing protein n=1 Tax=Streptomyces sp. NBC_00654 TaxID=2975799 RepID=UPI00225A2E49|nr:SH3 domain-containing protein [Streptomyces sp. NBC_00654]MCX4963944.1 SH3 domain-containing protein [Streptomyces sp. NBC_00654]
MGVEEQSTATVDTAVDTAVEAAVGTDGAASVEAASDDLAKYPIAPGYRVNVRVGPGTNYRIVRTLPYGMKVPIYCQKPGERVTGPYGTSNLWDNIANGQFVADAYVHTGTDGYVAPRCD